MALECKTVFENHRKSCIQFCKQSKLLLYFDWTKVSILASFWKPEACGQTVLPDRSFLVGPKLMENAKVQKLTCDILSEFQPLCTVLNVIRFPWFFPINLKKLFVAPWLNFPSLVILCKNFVSSPHNSFFCFTINFDQMFEIGYKGQVNK